MISKPQKPSKNRSSELFLLPFSEANSLEQYQNRIKTIAESYQNHKKAVPVLFLFLGANPSGTLKKALRSPNHIKTTSKTFRNHI